MFIYSLPIVIAVLLAGFIAREFVVPVDAIASDVRQGKSAHHVLLGLPAFSFGADPATIYWPATPSQPTTPAQKGPDMFQHCLMYLGQANGTTVLYDVNDKSAIRVPSNTIIVQSHPEWKGSYCKP